MTSDELHEIILCSEDYWYFLTNFVQTQHATQGTQPYPRYEFLRELLYEIHQHRQLLCPKSRQMLVTWTSIAYFIWLCIFHGPGLYLFISRTERCAEELIARALFIIQHLPAYMRPALISKSREQLSFEGVETRILSLPAVPDAPRMHSPSGVFWDEMAFTPLAEQMWTALQPCLQSGGKFIGVSSSNGPSGIFYELLDSPGEKGFHVHRIHWREHPDHDQEWENFARRGLSLEQWNTEMEISFDAPSIIVYSEFQTALHIAPSNLPINKTKPTFRSIDFGYHHPFVLWLSETSDGQILIFDEFCGENLTTEQLVLEIQRIDKTHNIDELDICWTSADPAGAQPTDAGISQVETLQRHGIKIRHRNSHIPAGIELVKSFLRDAFDEIHLQILPRCEHLIQHLQHYRWDIKRETPLKDGINDHSMDAMRYFFVNYHSLTVTYKPRVS